MLDAHSAWNSGFQAETEPRKHSILNTLSRKDVPHRLSLTLSFHKVKYEVLQLQELVLIDLPRTIFFFFFCLSHTDPSLPPEE